MKKLLMICHSFPPVLDVGALRPAGFATYLPRYGWSAVVVTPKHPDVAMGIAPEQTVFPHAEIIPSTSWNPVRGAMRIFGMERERFRQFHPILRNDDSPSPARSSLGIWMGRLIYNWLWIPDRANGWYPFAVLKASQRLLQGDIQALFSTSEPLTSHLVALRIKQRTGLPWVADFRDPLVEEVFSPRRRQLQKRILAGILRAADRVIMASEELREIMLAAFPGHEEKYRVIYNGFEPDLLQSIPKDLPSQFTLGYVGSMFPGVRDPKPFLQAVSELLAEGTIPRDNFKLRIVGPSPLFCHHLVQPFGLEPVLEAPGPVSHLDSLKYMVQSHVLWLVVPKPFIISAKIFYYLGAGRPILGVAPLGGSLDQLLQQTGMGVTLAPEDIAGIKRVLVQWYRASTENRPILRPNREAISRFDRSRQAGALAQFLDELCHHVTT